MYSKPAPGLYVFPAVPSECYVIRVATCYARYLQVRTCQVQKIHDGMSRSQACGVQQGESPFQFARLILEAVHLDLVLLCQVVANQEGRHVLALVTLQLQDLAQLLVLHHGAVAAVLCSGREQEVHERPSHHIPQVTPRTPPNISSHTYASIMPMHPTHPSSEP